jgi:uncharacterized membrane protein
VIAQPLGVPLRGGKMSIMAIALALHMIGLVIWLGAGTLFPLFILPALNGVDEGNRRKFLSIFTNRFLPYFVVSGIVVGLTGWYQTVQMSEDLILPAIIAKHIVILVLIVVSAYYWLYLARRLSKPEPTNKILWNQFTILAWVQAALGIIILIITGWLTS